MMFKGAFYPLVFDNLSSSYISSVREVLIYMSMQNDVKGAFYPLVFDNLCFLVIPSVISDLNILLVRASLCSLSSQ
ncbi:hypothetical protein RIF29_18691 [Crotalaria pallida]|uniref:Uncharacterized protein n=1 Tax=Crotalaria pallida TaxID=3830 RepID=A0AAN9EYM5_CROPI